MELPLRISTFCFFVLANKSEPLRYVKPRSGQDRTSKAGSGFDILSSRLRRLGKRAYCPRRRAPGSGKRAIMVQKGADSGGERRLVVPFHEALLCLLLCVASVQPDAEASRSLSIRLSSTRNLERPQDLRG